MTLGGWIFLILSWAVILGLLVFCFSRIFKKGFDGDDAGNEKK